MAGFSDSLRLFLLLPSVWMFGCIEAPRTKLPREPEPVAFMAPSKIAQVALGEIDLCIRLDDGRVLCRKNWRPSSKRFPAASFLAMEEGAVDIALGSHHACARKIDATVSCWGLNERGEVGGDESIVAKPRAVEGLAGTIEVRLHGSETCARAVDGTVRCWGNIGAAEHVMPIELAPMKGVSSLAVGAGHLCARRSDGSVHCAYGIAAPIVVAGLEHARDIVMAGARACVTDEAGSVHCWMLGRPKVAVPAVCASFVETSTPDLVMAPKKIAGLAEVTQMALGRAHACARRNDGSVWCWGENDYGQLGDGSRVAREAPRPVAHVTDALEVIAGGDRACALLARGEVVCWGRDLQDDAMFHALTGTQIDLAPPSNDDSLVPEPLRVPAMPLSG